MFQIQREIGVKQRIGSKISACGGPNKREGIKTIDFEIGLKKIPGTPKSKKKTLDPCPQDLPFDRFFCARKDLVWESAACGGATHASILSIFGLDY